MLQCRGMAKSRTHSVNKPKLQSGEASSYRRLASMKGEALEHGAAKKAALRLHTPFEKHREQSRGMYS